MIFKKLSEWWHSTRSTIWCIKCLPVIGTIFMTLHCILLLCGINIGLVEFVVGFPISSMLMFFVLSKQFKFCALHKCHIIYVAIMDICIFLQTKGFWGILLTPMRWLMLTIGMGLLVWTIVHYYTHVH